MQLVGVLRTLVRRWPLVVLGLALAVMAGVELGSTRSAGSTSASARVLIDTPDRPSIELGSRVADTLGLRAGLLGDLMATTAAQRSVAALSGISPRDLAVIGPAADPPPVQIPLAVAATEAAAAPQATHVLSVAASGKIPIIALRADAPDAATATRIVRAATLTLERIVETRSTRGVGLRAEPLGAVVPQTTPGVPRQTLGALAATALSFAWCAAIVAGSWAAGLWRARRRRAHRAT
jgi:hypothetical protein